jgi:hypothetical protein
MPQFSPRAGFTWPTPSETTPEHDDAERRAICVTGSYADRAKEAIEYSERHRQLAKDRRARLYAQEREQLARRRRVADMAPPSAAEVDAVTDDRTQKDAVWKGHVANEAWGLRLAEAYAALNSTHLQRTLLGEQRRTNQLLEQILASRTAS